MLANFEKRCMNLNHENNLLSTYIGYMIVLFVGKNIPPTYRGRCFITRQHALDAVKQIHDIL